MSGEFDPYHRWLGIPPKDQPANYYRLLGLEPFEADPEVIRDAAGRQMGFVRTFQLGQYLEVSQRILNELAAAKACLLDPAKKAAYDASLPAPAAPPIQVAAPPVPPPVVVPPMVVAGPPEIPEVTGPLDEVEGALPSDEQATVAVAEEPDLTREAPPPWPTGIRPRARPLGGRPAIVWASVSVAAAMVLLIGVVVIIGPVKPPPPPPPPSRPPVVLKQPDMTVYEDTEIRFAVVVTDPGSSERKDLRYSLAAAAPPGATIDATTGLFAWTPARARTDPYPITVQVQAGGPGELGAQTTFKVFVRKPSAAADNVSVRKPPTPADNVVVPKTRRPVLADIPPQSLPAGKGTSISVRLIDAGEPRGTTTYSLREHPEWVSINSATGDIRIRPPQTESPGPSTVTVVATSDAGEGLYGSQTFTINVEPPPPPPSKITLPSGKTLVLADLDVLSTARNEAGRILQGCLANDPRAACLLEDAPEPAIAALFDFQRSQPDGATVLFYPRHGGDKFLSRSRSDKGRGRGVENPTAKRSDDSFHGEPKQYANYDNGKRSGLLATWDANGQREFWGNYKTNQREGLCCLFDNDVLSAVFECSSDRIDVVYLVKSNEVTATLKRQEASEHTEASAMLKRADQIDKRLKDENREFCKGVTRQVHMLLGMRAKEKREAAEARAAERYEQSMNTIRAMWKAGTPQ